MKLYPNKTDDTLRAFSADSAKSRPSPALPLRSLVSLLLALCLTFSLCGCDVIDKTAELLSRLRGTISQSTPADDDIHFKSPADFESGERLYYYDNLSEAGKTIYIALLDGVKRHDKEIYILPAAQEEIKQAYEALSYDNPDIICLAAEYSWAEGVEHYTFLPKYTMTREECDIKSSELRAIAWQVISQAPEGATDYDKALFFHDYVIKSCSYCFEAISDYAAHIPAYTAYGMLIEGQAVCEGYSRAMQLLMKLAGISCTIVLGQTEDDNGMSEHMWNLALIDGEWYHIDTTFDDQAYSETEPDTGDAVSHVYLNLNDTEISADHFNISSPGIVCTSTTAGYFARSGSLVTADGDAAEAALSTALTAAFSNKLQLIEIKMANTDIFNSVFDSVVPTGRLYDIIMDSADSAGVIIDRDSLKLVRLDTQNIIRIKVAYTA